MHGRQSSAPLEDAPEKRRVLVTNVSTDRVGRALRGFEQALGFLDAKVLQIVHQREPGRRFEASLKGALRHARMLDGASHGAALAVVFRQPELGVANRGVRVRQRFDERPVR